MTKILIADDHQKILEILGEYAKKGGYEVLTANNGEDALNLTLKEKPDIVLLDVMMPKKDGFEVCREIRKTSMVPVIMITARGEDFEKIMGLDIGADDYIVKPFSPGEVMARVRALLRRIEEEEHNEDRVLNLKNLSIHLDRFETTINDVPIPLTKKEMEMLWLFASYPGKVFTRDNLLDSLWGIDYFGDSRTVDSHIKRLRAKIKEQPHPEWDIVTVRGVGYKLETTP